MLCEKCGKNEATYYYHENVNGRVRTLRLCGGCADAMEKSDELPKLRMDRLFGDFDPFFDDPFFSGPMKAMNGLLSGIFGDRALGSGTQKEKREGKVCPGCGSTLRDIATRGTACPRCFETFAEELAPSVGRAHGKAAHAGRVPARFRDRIERRRKIEALVAEQREAVRNEDFERAAGIRDELKKLRAEEKAEEARAESAAVKPEPGTEPQAAAAAAEESAEPQTEQPTQPAQAEEPEANEAPDRQETPDAGEKTE